MKTFQQIVADALQDVEEIMPWDLEEKLQQASPPLLIDVREPHEFEAMHIKGSINVPRGILETACEYNYDETEPTLADAREQEVVVICRSGNRSVLACSNMQLMGYKNVVSLKTGLRGWNDYEQPLIDGTGNDVDIDDAEEYFTPHLRPDQEQP
ncbi:MAG: rhodanese-like domain-containing protein [Granulosicoccaceae bacterium]|jgi:rhodanese-related sulfurtransferase